MNYFFAYHLHHLNALFAGQETYSLWLLWNIKITSHLYIIQIVSTYHFQYTFSSVSFTFILMQKELNSYCCSNCIYYLQSVAVEYHIQRINAVWTRFQLFTCTSTVLLLQVLAVYCIGGYIVPVSIRTSWDTFCTNSGYF